jgi:alkanesulfonate monooxygenase SsuD/methylene tetrahydromethanopterin reductase-like flavin-dependent oxidoreductase (luciferase family)
MAGYAIVEAPSVLGLFPGGVERVQRLEALDYDHLWTYDHLSWRRYREHDWHATIPWLTGAACATRRIRLGTMVASPNFRHPVTLAKDAMTLDHVSSGRLVLGIGAGGVGFDATVFGDEPLSARARTERLIEFVEIVDGLLREPRYSHRGTHYVVDDARMLPGCVQQPRVPLAIAAGGPRTLALTARYADAWITYGDTSHRDLSAAGTYDIVASQAEQLDAACVAIGRDPAEIDRIYLIGNTEERPLASPGAFADFAGRYAALGFTDLVFHHPVPGDPVWTEPDTIVEELATEVLPRLR